MSTVKLFKPYKTGVKTIIFDIDIFPKINKLDIRILEQVERYCIALTTKGVRCSHLVLPCPKGFVIDHINRNSLDNRRCNLRVATSRQNSMNRNKITRGITTSKYKGVYRKPIKESRRKPWAARISVDGKLCSPKYFSTEEEAALRYNEWALELYGEFAVLNQVPK